MAITTEQAQANLTRWMEASAAAGVRKSYSIHGRTLTYQDLSEITKMIDYWQAKLDAAALASVGRGRSRVIIPAG